MEKGRSKPRATACATGWGGARGAWTQAIGASRDGQTSKIHSLADDRDRPVALALTPGSFSDIRMALSLLETIASPKRLLADRAYDADSLRNWLKARRVKPVIPSSGARTVPYTYNGRAHRRRNVIERLFCRLNNWRRIAAHYDRLAANYLAGVALVAAVTEWSQ